MEWSRQRLGFSPRRFQRDSRAPLKTKRSEDLQNCRRHDHSAEALPASLCLLERNTTASLSIARMRASISGSYSF